MRHAAGLAQYAHKAILAVLVRFNVFASLAESLLDAVIFEQFVIMCVYIFAIKVFFKSIRTNHRGLYRNF